MLADRCSCYLSPFSVEPDKLRLLKELGGTLSPHRQCWGLLEMHSLHAIVRMLMMQPLNMMLIENTSAGVVE